MGRIQILSDELVNKIAAGEVVERPASAVKELLENALDAGADELRIEVEAGGRRLIRVIDNGSGMMRDDALLAFERHATSKIRSAADLFQISTLGFRGEALPSIAAVSRLTLETRAAEEQTGTVVEIAGGKIVRCQDTARAPGTSVTVRDLFFNVPVRRKFLRSEQTELAHIASLVTHYSLAQWEKSFELRHNGSELLRVSPAGSLRERVYQVFGARLLEDLVELVDCRRQIPADENGSPVCFQLSGFVSRPQLQKTNRNAIYLFINRRFIRDRLLLHALQAAYHNLIPPTAFPFALLLIDCPAEEVDVNVHPTKTEVRFKRASFVHDFVRDAIRETLSRIRPVSSLPAQQAPQPAAELPYSEFSQRLIDQAFEASQPPAPLTREQEQELPEFLLRPPPSAGLRFDFTGDIGASREAEPQEPAASRLRLPVPDTHGAFPQGAILDAPASMDALAELRPLGQLQESFIIAAARDGLWIIDQHVAHERILFEKVLQDWGAGRMPLQQLLVPPILELNPSQWIEYERIRRHLAEAGFETEPMGQRAIAVKTAPAALPSEQAEKLIFEILEISETELRSVSVEDLRRAMAASIACRAAIKINTRLEPTKIEWLLAELARTQYPMSCPHGRPVALRYAMREILRSFHRI